MRHESVPPTANGFVLTAKPHIEWPSWGLRLADGLGHLSPLIGRLEGIRLSDSLDSAFSYSAYRVINHMRHSSFTHRFSQMIFIFYPLRSKVAISNQHHTDNNSIVDYINDLLWLFLSMLVCLPVEFRFTYSNFRFVKIVRCWSWCTRWWWWRIDGCNETVKWQSKVWLSLVPRSHLRHIPAWPLQKLDSGFRDSGSPVTAYEVSWLHHPHCFPVGGLHSRQTPPTSALKKLPWLEPPPPRLAPNFTLVSPLTSLLTRPVIRLMLDNASC